ncbi:tetraspanin 37 isoform X1 [Anguilla rostrata]
MRRIVKVVLQITCQLLWLAGLVVGLSGLYLLLNYRHNRLFFRDIYIILPAVMAIASAVVLLISGSIGCWVSVRDSTCLQGVVGIKEGMNRAFVYLLIIIFCLEATAAALAYANIGKVHSELAPFQNIFKNYNGSSQDPDSNAVDSIQEELQCCGIQNYTDWQTTTWFNHRGNLSVPQSCCNSTFHTCHGTLDQTYMLYPQGCQVKLEDAIGFILHLIIYSTAAVAVVQIIGLVSVAQLMRQQPLQGYQILERNTIN